MSLQPVIHFFFHANPLVIYLIVAVVLLLESSGVPIANNTLLLFTGALASYTHHLDIGLLGIAAILGSIAGAFLAYSIGIYGGRLLVLRVTKLFHIDEQKVLTTEQWFQKSGVWMVFFSRMIPFVRPFACFPAGISRMPLPRFLLAASFGSIIWCIALLSIGWNLGRRWPLALAVIQSYTFPSLCVLALLLVVYVLLIYAIKRYVNTFAPPPSETKEKHQSGELIEV